MKTIKLSRQVKVNSFIMKAIIGYREKQPFMGAIAQIVREHKNSSFDQISKQIRVELLDNETKEVISINLLRRLELLKIINIDHYSSVTLTTTGEQLVESGQLISPKEDVFEFDLLLDDDLLSPRVLNSKPIPITKENNAWSKVKDMKNKFEKNKDIMNYWQSFHEESKNHDTLPDNLDELFDNEYRLFSGDNIYVFSIAKYGKIINNKKKINLEIEFTEFQLKYSLISGNNKIILNDDSLDNFDVNDYYEIMYQLLKDENYEFNISYRSIMISQDKLIKFGENAINTATTDIILNNPKVYHKDMNYGIFRKSKIKNVKLMADSTETASFWADQLLRIKISNYLDIEHYKEICMEIAELTQFGIHKPEFANFNDMLNGLIFGEKLFWYMQTKIDLNEEVIL